MVLVSALIVLLIVDIIARKTNNELLDNRVLPEAGTHDLVTEDNGIFGYTAIDFQEAVLGDPKSQAKLEVIKIPASEIVDMTDAGFANLSVFSKIQYIKLHTDVIYTVDLSQLSKRDILVDEKNQTVTIYIPHSQLENVVCSLQNAEYIDKKRGVFAFGDFKFTTEEIQAAEKGASDKIVQSLDGVNMSEQADKFAKLSVYNIYQPVINSVAKEYKLVIEFDD